MMTSVTGKRGIGKTYLLAKELYQRSLDGFFTIANFSHIYANIDCSAEDPDFLFQLIREIGIFKERGYELVDLDPHFIHSGIFIAIDEAHLYFSADLYKRYQNDPEFLYILKFLAQARKTDVEIWYSTQDPAKVDINWRRYTEDYIRYVPCFPFNKKIDVLVQRRRREDGTLPAPYLRREIRYRIPLLREEHHDLDPNNPTFNYQMVTGHDGRIQMGPQSTLNGSRLVRSGWLDPFPYRLYNSNQMLAMKGDPLEKDFSRLLQFSYIPHTFSRERFPTFKRLFGITAKDSALPVRQKVSDRLLPQPPQPPEGGSPLSQPVELLNNLKYMNRHKNLYPMPTNEEFPKHGRGLRRLLFARSRSQSDEGQKVAPEAAAVTGQ